MASHPDVPASDSSPAGSTSDDPVSTEDPRFVEIARFPSRMEAETVGHALDEHGIPFLVQSSDVGMFGPGMSGFTPEGAQLMVPEHHRRRVEELLTCVVRPLAEGERVDLEAAAERSAEGNAEEGDPT